MRRRSKSKEEIKVMEIKRCNISFSFSFLSLLLLSSLLHSHRVAAIKKSYVVYLGGHSHGPDLSSVDLNRVTETHHEFLGSFLGSQEKAKDAMFYSYNKYINGFAAYLEEEEAEEISKHPDVISVFLNKGKMLHTTRSWNFLGFERNGDVLKGSLWKKARFGEDVIIGSLDSGVWPESESFSDEDIGPIPSKWKGFCQNNTKLGVSCNRKLIGARYFNKGEDAYRTNTDPQYHSARDTIGHGTHTLSTVGGRFVRDVNISNLGNGMAKGGAPNARLAAYKVCWPPINSSIQCPDADILAAFDAAIQDGVDVLSISLGGSLGDYLYDSIAIGSFHAVRNGITVVCSAGNEGPSEARVGNLAPWILTVGASSIDRDFISYVELGNKMRLRGQSLSATGLPERKLYPLITSTTAKAANASEDDARLCLIGSLDPMKVKGKIVTCIRGDSSKVEKGKGVLDAGGVGMILVNGQRDFDYILPDLHVLPTSHVSAADGETIFNYIDFDTKNPVAYIEHTTTQLDVKPAPVVAYFSSQGPNNINPEILKPDLVAPGVNIIAAFSPVAIPSDYKYDERRVLFNSLSGTSMACPHVSGVVALLKNLHPDWSPAAIKSALMTTARNRSNMKEPMLQSSNVLGTPFSSGAGHIRPNRAVDPGLVYDLTIYDHLNFLCAVGYNKSQINKFIKGRHHCPKSIDLLNFNYPAITIPKLYGEINLTRTLKNVGSPGTYNVKISEPFRVSVKVEPKSLKFEKIGEEKKFMVTLKVKGSEVIEDYVSGKLDWTDGVHHVRSPIVVMEGI